MDETTDDPSKVQEQKSDNAVAADVEQPGNGDNPGATLVVPSQNHPADTSTTYLSPHLEDNQSFVSHTSNPSSYHGGLGGWALDAEAANAMEVAKKRLQINREAKNTHKVTLDGLLEGVNQFEHEATTHILKSLDDKARNTNGVAFDGSSIIMPNLPQEASDSISEPMIARLADEDLPAVANDEANPGDTGSRTRADSDTRPLLAASQGHRREMSVEDQLAGLVFDMIHLDRQNEVSPKDNSEPIAKDDFTENANRVMSSVPRSHRRIFSTRTIFLSPVTETNSDENLDYGDSQRGDVENQGIVAPTENADSPNANVFGDIPPSKRPRKSIVKAFGGAADRLKDDLDAWNSIFDPSKGNVFRYLLKVFIYVVLPLVGIAALLFYGFDNPVAGKNVDGSPDDGGQASSSWWLLFVARQSITFALAVTLQKIIIDYLCVGTRALPRILGPAVRLLIVQSKGWPFVIFTWSILDFCMLYGSGPFAAHWGYAQTWLGLFNQTNPSGIVVDSDWNRRILLIAITVPLAATLKRFGVGLFLGRQTYMHYGEALAKVMNKMVLVSQVAAMGKKTKPGSLEASKMKGRAPVVSLSATDDADLAKQPSSDLSGKAFISDSERFKLMQLLDRWEEPERLSKLQQNASISAVLKFRNAMTLIRDTYPFTYSFGPAATRVECVESAQKLYERICQISLQSDNVTFETLALTALRSDGSIDQAKAKDLVRVFRPNRDGTLSMLDFVKSIDAVYKEFRLLQASIENSTKIDRAFERILNVVFYALILVIIVAALGFDPLSLFLSMSSVILAFAFVIGSASSKYFEGVLFILGRRPFGIGDLINVNGIDQETGLMGSIGWIVQNVTLFETTMTWLPTLETATVANGSLASSRIVNWARSPNARFVIFLYFPIETTYETLELFRGAVEEYMKARPREWLAFNAFRVLAIHTNKGYMHLELVVQHREAWQNPGAIYDSRGNLVSYCNEVQKLLGMQYRTPPLPIDIRAGADFATTMLPNNGQPPMPGTSRDETQGSDDPTTLSDKIRFAATNKHKIFF